MTPRARLLTDLAGRVLATVTPGHPTRVAVDGCSAAGKSTLAGELAATLGTLTARPVLQVSADHFKRPLHLRTAHPAGTPDSYYHDMFDLPALRDLLLAPLGPGGDRRYHTRITDVSGRTPLPSPAQLAAPDAILIVDGGFLQKPFFDELWDLRVFLDIGLDDVLARGTARDQAWMDSPEAAAERYRSYYIPAEKRYLTEVDPASRADVVVDNRDFHNPFFRTP